MAHNQNKNSINLLQKNWHIDPLIHSFMLGQINEIQDHKIKINKVIFHIPFLTQFKKFVLWKCFWPDCNNCCDRQGRLPLTSKDIISISKKNQYNKTSDFIRNETLITTWDEQGPHIHNVMMTTVNLKRKLTETPYDDGKHMSCRFLDKKGYCTLHPVRPGVCHLYPFSVWLENKNNVMDVHSTFQLTGDCPGFYTSRKIRPIKNILNQYSDIIYNYCMDSNRTSRQNFSSILLN